MSEPRLCEVCRRRPATRRCRLCGRLVCSEDYDESRGICRFCAETLCEVCGERLAVASCEVCGRLVCDECGVQLTPVVWLCPSCAARFRGEWPPRSLVLAEARGLASRLSRVLR